jgi:hypothetical protein
VPSCLLVAPPAPTKRLRLLSRLLIAAGLYVLTVNMAVRHYGGDANPVSVLRLSEKSRALLLLSLHSVKHLWNSDCAETTGIIADAARAEGIPTSYALAIARNESGYRSHTISSTGAMGVMQLMPRTATQFGVSDPFDPGDNARGGARYLHALWRRYHGNKLRVAAAYNAGQGSVPLVGPMHVPATTLGYASRVVKHDQRALPVVLREPLVITADVPERKTW